MKVIKIAKAKPRRVPFGRERDIYALFEAMPEVLSSLALADSGLSRSKAEFKVQRR